MGRECASSFTDSLRSANPTEHTRWLAEPDERAFRELLQARYAETYSYPFLYEPGGVLRLWRTGTLLSLGEFDAHGTLLWHTGLWSHPGRDCVDSGLSVSQPSRRTAMSRSEHERLWRYLLDALSGRVAFLHQHTSTLHPMAQRYASRFMRAVPMGLVVNYTRGETLRGIAGSGVPMQALAMSTVLAPPPPRRRYLPAGAWGEWLASILAGVGLAETAVMVAPEPRAAAPSCLLRTLDWNESLRLERRELVRLEGPQGASALTSSRARVDLVHLPTGEPQRVAEATPVLLAAGYVPTGIRLRQDAPDEIVFQHLVNPGEAREAVARARLDGTDARALFAGWSERCARTS